VPPYKRPQLIGDPLGGPRENLNWEAIGALAELIGAIGVIASPPIVDAGVSEAESRSGAPPT
jgi:hypothetical protein